MLSPEELRTISDRFLVVHPSPGVTGQSLALVLAMGSFRKLVQDEILCTEGETGDSLYVLLKGSIRVTRRDHVGRARALTTMSAPALVGHMSLVDNSPRSATCTAEGAVTVAAFDRRTYGTLVSEATPRGTAMRRVLLASLTRQLGDSNDRIKALINESEDNTAQIEAVRRPESGRSAQGGPGHHEGEEGDEADIFRIAGVLHGWKVDASAVAAAERLSKQKDGGFVQVLPERQRNRSKT